MKNNVKVQDGTQSLQSCVSVSVTELRIGNLLMTNNLQYRPKDAGKIAYVVAIDAEKNFEKLKGSCTIYHLENKYKDTYGQWIKFLKPIPLTEEWLLKVGFSVINESSAGKKYGYVIDGVFSSDLTFIFWKTTKDTGKFFKSNLQLKWIHQLQNFYYALTGSELQIGDLTEH